MAIDSLLVTKDPGSSYTRHSFQRKAFHLASASGGILVAYAGYRKFGVLKALYDQGSAHLDPKPRFEAIVEMFASFIAPQLTRESIKDRQPQPAEFILGSWWSRAEPALAVVRPNEVHWPRHFQTVAIGGKQIGAARNDLENRDLSTRLELEESLLALLSTYILASPAANYDFPAFWIALTGPEAWKWGFVDSSIHPVLPPPE